MTDDGFCHCVTIVAGQSAEILWSVAKSVLEDILDRHRQQKEMQH
jgi:hypothetical protein